MDDVRLRQAYYDPQHVGSFGGVQALAKGAGTSVKNAKRWLTDELTYTLHKPARIRYVTRPYRTSTIDRQWQGDLVEMNDFVSVNKGYKYILTVVDLFSRYAWARALKNKTGQVVTKAFESILKEGRKPHYFQSDEGLEFDNRHFQHLLNLNDIEFFTVKSQFKAAVVERFNRI